MFYIPTSFAENGSFPGNSSNVTVKDNLYLIINLSQPSCMMSESKMDRKLPVVSQETIFSNLAGILKSLGRKWCFEEHCSCISLFDTQYYPYNMYKR